MEQDGSPGWRFVRKEGGVKTRKLSISTSQDGRVAFQVRLAVPSVKFIASPAGGTSHSYMLLGANTASNGL